MARQRDPVVLLVLFNLSSASVIFARAHRSPAFRNLFVGVLVEVPEVVAVEVEVDEAVVEGDVVEGDGVLTMSISSSGSAPPLQPEDLGIM